MEQSTITGPRRATGHLPFSMVAASLGVTIVQPASAQLTRATNTLTTISTWMQGLGVTIITIAVIWAGIKMIFGQQQMRDLGGVFWGAFLIGGASLIASFFFTGTSS